MESDDQRYSNVKSLYQLALIEVVKSKAIIRIRKVDDYPVKILCDLYYQMFRIKMWRTLIEFFCDLDTILKLITQSCGQRQLIHMIFQTVIQCGVRLDMTLATDYRIKAEQLIVKNRVQRYQWVKLGYSLANFFIEAGWYKQSLAILGSALTLCTEQDDHNLASSDSYLNQASSTSECHSSEAFKILAFSIRIKILNCCTSLCKLSEAEDYLEQLKQYIDRENLTSKKDKYDVSQAYTQIAWFNYFTSREKKAFKYINLAIECLSKTVAPISLIETLCIAAIIYSERKEFLTAYSILKSTSKISNDIFRLSDVDDECSDAPRFHLCWGKLLEAWGNYYLHRDHSELAVKFFKKSLNFKRCYFTGSPSKECINLPVAISHKELAYALYVYGYTRSFDGGIYHAKKAESVFSQILLGDDHLFLVDVKRIIALHLEEMAIDTDNLKKKHKFLDKALELHTMAVNIVKDTLKSEENLQVAKHYSNLGRLYQTMKKYDLSESFHLRSIEIKQAILGNFSYELAVSYSLLASLYNYEMNLFKRAHLYYSKSIDIFRTIFGESYSGLEFDYQGLLRIYKKQQNYRKVGKMYQVIKNWLSTRDTFEKTSNEDPFQFLTDEPKFDIDCVKNFISKLPAGP